jgi:hypothetical protein
MPRRLVPILACALLAPAAAALAAGAARPPEPALGRGLTLSAARAEIDRLVIETGDPLNTAPARHAVTDLMVRLLPPGAAGRFDAEILAVVGGRIARLKPLSCAPWRGQATVCAADCDGGGVMLRRLGGSARFLVSFGASEAEGGGGRGIALDACAEGEPGLAVLGPRPGLARADILLAPP